MGKMTWVAAALLLGCACSDGGQAAEAPEWRETSTEVAPLVVPDGALCFRNDSPLLDQAFGDFEAVAKVAAAAWDREIVIDDRCKSAFGVEDLVGGNGLHEAAVERTWVTSDGVEMPAGVDGGASLILFDTEMVLDGHIANLTVEDCESEWDANGTAHPLLLRLLVHEMGHALGLGESEEQSDAMWWFGGSCLYIAPNAAEVAATR